MSRTRSSRYAAGLVAGVLVAQLLNPVLAQAAEPSAGPEPATVTAPPSPEGPTATEVAVAAATADSSGRVAVPVLRERTSGGAVPFLYVIRPAAFGLSPEQLAAAGLPLVPPPGPDGVPVASVQHLAVPLEDVVATVGALAAEEPHDSPGAVTMSSAAAAAGDVAMAVYVDTSNDSSIERVVAQDAWNDAQTVHAAENGVTFSVVLYQDNAVAFPDNAALRVSDVTNDCELQRFSRWEETFGRRADAVLVFSDGQVAVTGKGPHFGVAINGPLSRQLSEGESEDLCTPGATRSPTYLPTAHVSTDAAGYAPFFSQKQAPSHWAAHEVGHIFTMTHDHASCVDGTILDGGVWHQHQTLEAATAEVASHCTSNNTVRHHHFTFAAAGRAAIRDEDARWERCRALTWCDTWATTSKVLGLQGVPANGQVSLSWQPPQHHPGTVTGYCVHWSTEPNFLERAQETSTYQFECLPPDQLNYTWSGLTNGQPSYFYVRAQNWRGEGPASDPVTVKPGTTPNSPVLDAPVPGDRQVSLSWNVPAGNGYPVTSYKVFRGTCSLCQTYLTTVTSTSYVDRDAALVNGRRYYYQVSAVNDRGEGPRSNEQSTYPRTSPGAPTLIAASPANKQVTLTWNPPSADGGDPVTGYRVYRGTVQSGGKSLVEAGGCKSTVTGGYSCTDTDPALVNGVRYYYAVKAVNSAGDGASSNELGAMPANTAEEEWEAGLHGWTTTGSGVSGDCSTGVSGCSLRMVPADSAGASASRPMPVTLESPTAVSFWFRGDWTSGDTDVSVGIGLDTGNEVRLSLTDPAAYDQSMNNGVSLSSPGAATGTFYHWPYYQEWYQAVVLLDPATDRVSARVKTASGAVVGTSSGIALPAAATAVTKVTFDGVFWGGTSVGFSFDRLKVNDPAAVAAFAETWDGGLAAWTVTGSTASSDCAVAFAGCSLKVESLDSAGVTVAKPVWVDLTQPTAVSFWLRGSRTWGDTDASIGIGLNTQNEVRLAITEPADNNGMNLYTPNGSSGVFYNWPAANTWYRVVVTVDPVADVARVQVRDASGNVLRTSADVAIPANASALNRLSFDAVHWGGTAVTFHVDALTVG